MRTRGFIGDKSCAPRTTCATVTENVLDTDQCSKSLRDCSVRRPWAVGYLACIAFAIGGGVYSSTHVGAEFVHSIDSGFMNDGRNCPTSGLRALHADEAGISDFKIKFAAHAILWLAISAAGSLMVRNLGKRTRKTSQLPNFPFVPVLRRAGCVVQTLHGYIAIYMHVAAMHACMAQSSP